jgi:lsr operon transcriptional repressor
MKKRRTSAIGRHLEGTDEDLITRIAWLYYKEKLTQQQIAERILLSRQKVQRLLEKARDLEIIQFNLKHPFVNLMSIEIKIRQHFGLKDAVVTPTSNSDPDLQSRSLGIAGAAYLARKLGAIDTCTLGIGWGNTTSLIADYFEPQMMNNRIKIVSLMGNLMLNVSMNPYIMAENIARKLGASCYHIWAPAIAKTRTGAEMFKSEPWIKEVLDIGCQSDIILISIGQAAESASLFKMGYLSQTDLRRLIGKGAVGDILCRYFNANGEFVKDNVHDRVIGIPKEVFGDERKLIIGVAGGTTKVAAIRAALLKKYINVLITDESTAIELLRPETKQM